MMQNYYQIRNCTGFADFVDYIASKHENKPAFQTGDEIWTYKTIGDYVKKLLPYFSTQRETLYMLRIDNLAHFISSFFATIISGNIVVLEDSSDPSNCFSANQILDEKWFQATIRKEEFGANIEVGSKVDGAGAEGVPAVIAHSSGTTAEYKYVVLTEKNIIDNMIGSMECYEFAADSVYLSVLPATHLFGLVGDLLAPLYSGAKICFPRNKLQFFSCLTEHNPSCLNLPPILVEHLWKKISSVEMIEDVVGNRLKKILCGGAPLNQLLIDQFDKYGIKVYTAYGLTECSPCVSINSELASKKGSVGRIIPPCEVIIKNDEVLVRGSTVMLGYYNDIEATNKTIVDGWLHTGDTGYIEDGFLYITGRKTNLIVFEDATKIVPETIEEQLAKLRFINEVVVYPFNDNGRVKICVRAYIDQGASDENIKKEVYQIIGEKKLLSKLHSIHFQYSPLRRNELGKIKRSNL